MTATSGNEDSSPGLRMARPCGTGDEEARPLSHADIVSDASLVASALVDLCVTVQCGNVIYSTGRALRPIPE